MKIEIIGTPFNGLGTPPDIEHPPDGLRRVGLNSALKDNDHTVIDLGNISGFQCQDIHDPGTGINDFGMWMDLSKEISQSIGSILNRNSFPLVLGGDCRILVGIITALIEKQRSAGLVFIDGHADFHTAQTSPSGDPADMELAILTGRGPKQITSIADKYPILNDSDVVVYGIRSWDHIDESNIEVYDKKRMAEVGYKRAVEEGLRSFVERELPIWLHFDVDVLDPAIMPVMYPEPGGLSFEEAKELLILIWKSCKVEGLSVACYHPRLDKDKSAGKKLVSLISQLLS